LLVVAVMPSLGWTDERGQKLTVNFNKPGKKRMLARFVEHRESTGFAA
jgi:hypothetical protein